MVVYICQNPYTLFTKSEPQCKLRALGDNDVFISCNKCTTLGQNADSEGAGGGKAERIWQFSLLSAQFFCEPKTTTKSKVYIFFQSSIALHHPLNISSLYTL